MTARVGQDAIDYTLSRVGTRMPDSGLCLQFTRQNFAIAALYASAIDAWNGSKYKQPGDRNPPPAVPVYFHTPSPYRHVAFHCYDGLIVSTFNDEIRQYPGGISQVESVFNGPYLGWAPGLNKVRVFYPDPAPIPEDEMARVSLIYTTGSQTWWAYDGLFKRALGPDEPQHLADVGLITAEQLAAGPSWFPNAEVDAIPDAS